MSARKPRFEVVRRDAGWLVRFVGANGREVWRTSEVYVRRAAAERAMWLLRDAAIAHFMWSETRPEAELETRDVDERGTGSAS